MPRIRNFLVSLKLTVALLVLSMLLVLFATLDQVNLGIWAVQQKWFHSFFVFGNFLGDRLSLPFFPGGYLIGGLLLLNLVAAHIYRFKLSLKKTGLHLAHLGLLVLLVGVFFSGIWQEDYIVSLREGQTATHAEGPNRNTPSGHPARRDFGFSLQLLEVTHDVHPGTDIPKNFASRVLLRDVNDPTGREVVIRMNAPLRHNGFTFYQNTMNAAAGVSGFQVVRNPARAFPYIACLLTGLGLLLHFSMSLLARQRPVTQTAKSADATQSRPIENRESKIENNNTRTVMRSTRMKQLRVFLPLVPALLCAIWIIFTLIPRKPASEFDIAGFGRLPVLADGRVKPLDTVARTTLLRIQGRQSVRAPDGRKVTPAEWLLDTVFNSDAAHHYRVFQITHPEVLALAQLTPADGDGKKRFSFAQLAPHLDNIEHQAQLAGAATASQRTAFQRAILKLYADLHDYRRLQYSFIHPESYNFLGDLMRLNETLAQPSGAGGARVPRADEGRLDPRNDQERDAGRTPSAGGTPALPENLREAAALMSAHASLLPIPPVPAARPQTSPSGLQNFRTSELPLAWLKTGDAITAAIDARCPIPPAAMAYAGLARTWQAREPGQFNKILHLYQTRLARDLPARDLGKINLEWRFNDAQPFFNAIILCSLAFLLGVASWARFPAPLARAAFWMLLLAWLLMTGGILARIWIEGRLPVANLYSTALGVGWCVVTLALTLEWRNKNAIAAVAGSLAGLCALLIAHNLSLSGDTLKMLPAVLDSFWLTLHVGTIIVGYAATFVAGALAAIHIIRSRLAATHAGANADTASLERIVYGIVCFALFFCFTGTVLGGIWADQSWGRFWGWDPKENGAIILVTWHAVVLHARRGGLVGPRGIMAMAVAGNIVVAWSWFGTNMLGIGLHSYGFMNSGLAALLGFVAFNLAVIALAGLPVRNRNAATAPWRKM